MNACCWFQYLGLIASVLARREEYDKIGYFWHITDVHYDSHSSHGDFRGCGRHEFNGGANGASSSSSKKRTMGRYGDYGCDATWGLIESAARHMGASQTDNVEFVLWTGDALSHGAARHLPEVHQLEILQNLTDLLGKTFPSQFVFPALGHDDPSFRSQLGKMWSRWLPTDSMKTFEAGGYYIIERKTLKLQIVVLNTNLMRKGENDEEALQQWKWVDKVLHKFRKNGERVYLVGHIPPGWDERQKHNHQLGHAAYADFHNKKYLQIVQDYADIVAGQFYGHLHCDTFRVIYDYSGDPVSWAMIAPSITPRRSHINQNNPGLRLYKFDKDTGQIFDYTQYYLDLSVANAFNTAEWKIEYNFSSYYGFNSVNALAMHSLAERMVSQNDERSNVFEKYYKANSVRINSINHNRNSCDAACIHTHYCSVTRVDRQEFEDCLKTAASALSSFSRNEDAQLKVHFVLVSVLLVWIVSVASSSV